VPFEDRLGEVDKLDYSFRLRLLQTGGVRQKDKLPAPAVWAIHPSSLFGGGAAGPGPYNDGYADNVSLVLSHAPLFLPLVMK
jgi:hypothetical protein